MGKSFLLLVILCSLAAVVMAERKSSSSENEFAKSNLFKSYLQFKHILASRHYCQNISENKLHVNKDESDQIIRVRREDKFPAAALETGGYGIGYVGPVYRFPDPNSKPNFKWGITGRGIQYGHR